MSTRIQITNFHVLRHRIFKVDPIVYVSFVNILIPYVVLLINDVPLIF